MGRDLIIYLRFLRYQATIFFVILIFNWSVLIPLYHSGSYAEKNYLNLETIELKVDENEDKTRILNQTTEEVKTSET